MPSSNTTFTLCLIALGFVFMPAIASAQGDPQDSLDKEMKEFLQEQRAEAEEFSLDIKNEYENFLDEIDREFADFLKNSWEEFEDEEPFHLVSKPKPEVMPQYVPPPSENVKPEVPVRIVIDKFVPPNTEPPSKAAPTDPIKTVGSEPETKPSKPEPKAPSQSPNQAPTIKTVGEDLPDSLSSDYGTPLSFMFFGRKVQLRYSPGINVGITLPINNKEIGKYWEKIAGSDFKPFLEQTLWYKDRFQLNDWGYMLFLDQAAREILTDPGENNRNLFIWFALTKAGYEIKVGYKDDRISILLPAAQKLFGLYYFRVKGEKYYSVNLSSIPKKLGQIFTFSESYPGAKKPLDFSLHSYPSLKKQLLTRHLSFSYRGQAHKIRVEYNDNSISFFKYYPQNKAGIYADAKVPEWIDDALISQFKPIIEGKSEEEAANMLLRFTQTAFDYKTDNDQFNREKFFFPEETLHYPFSDCEDRSILFSYLIRKLLSLDVVLLRYPNHLATAVRFNKEVRGDSVVVNGVNYIICDPTYINADLGLTMPKFRDVVPDIEILRLSSRKGE